MADLELTDKEKRILAYTLLGEAAGEGKEGMAAIMNVIMNRSASGRYPDNPAAVAIQANKAGVHQFSTWNKKGQGGNDPKSRFSTNSQEYREALDIVQAAMSGQLEDNTGGATHFVSKKMFEDAKPHWWSSEAPAGEVTIGGHVFGARNPNNALQAINTVTGTVAKGGKGVGGTKVSGLKGTGPQSEITGQPRPLATRVVQTVRVDPVTGSPIPSYVTAAETAAQRIRQKQAGDLVGLDARSSAVNAASVDKQSRSRAAQSADLVGVEATRPSLTGNLQSLTKEDRARPVQRQDLVGEEATQTPGNAAAASKTSRVAAKTPLEQAVERKAAVERAKLADIAAPKSPDERGALPNVARPVTRFATPKSGGVTKTTGPYQEPIPRDVRPKVTVAPLPKPEAPKPRSTPLPAEPKKVPANDALRLAYQAPSTQVKLSAGQTATAAPSGGSRRGRAKAGDIANAKTAQLGQDIRKPIVPTEPEIAAVTRGDIRKGANALRVAPAVKAASTRKVESWTPPRPATPPPVAPIKQVVNTIAQGGVPGLTQSSNYQESAFQWTENTYLPSAIRDNPRWW